MIRKKVYAQKGYIFALLAAGIFTLSTVPTFGYGQKIQNQFVLLLDDAPRMMRYLLADGSYSQIEKLYPTTIALHKSEFIDPAVLRSQKRVRLETLLQTHPYSRELVLQLYQLAEEDKNRGEMSLRRAQLNEIDPLFVVE
jgi:hypothetical protein